MTKWTGHVGTTNDGDRVWLDIELTEKDVQGRFNSADTHQPVESYTELTISGHGIQRGRRLPARDIDFGGQCIDRLRAVTRPAEGWTTGELADLADIWKRWHLNGMRAGCDHQEVVMEQDKYDRTVPSLDLTPPCPITGYRYGHAWLVATLPAEVVDRVRAYAARLDGTSPLR